MTVRSSPRVRLSESAENGFGADPKAILGDGHPVHCPIRRSLSHWAHARVCDAGHWLVVMKKDWMSAKVRTLAASHVSKSETCRMVTPMNCHADLWYLSLSQFLPQGRCFRAQSRFGKNLTHICCFVSGAAGLRGIHISRLPSWPSE